VTRGIRHVAVIELRADCAVEDRDGLVAQIQALSETVPDVLLMSAGVARGVDGDELNRVCLVSDHPSYEALAAYLDHPAHRAVAARVGELRESVAGADFEIDL
jgi:hypothetical protein